MKVVLGTNGDLQTVTAAKHADLLLYWEDITRVWDLLCDHDNIHLLIIDRQTKLILNSEVQIYIRYDSMHHDEATQRKMLVLISLVAEWTVNGFDLSCNFLTNKLSQLALFGELCPETRVTNRLERIQNLSSSIVKGISTLKTKADRAAHVDLSNPGRIPVQLQEPLEGIEYKLHCLFHQAEVHNAHVRCESDSSAIDKRYAGKPALYSFDSSGDSRTEALAQKIFQSMNLRFFDMDYFIFEGRVVVLELNDSPESGFFEAKTQTNFFPHGLFREDFHEIG